MGRLIVVAMKKPAPASEVLGLDVDELDLRNRKARVSRKGGAVDVIVWQTGTARLLPRLLEGRRAGPLFLTERRAQIALPAGDLDPGSGQARLSYRRAAEVFATATGEWTLHQLRHSALTHAAEAAPTRRRCSAYSRAHAGDVVGALCPRVTRSAGSVATTTRPGPPASLSRLAGTVACHAMSPRSRWMSMSSVNLP